MVHNGRVGMAPRARLLVIGLSLSGLAACGKVQASAPPPPMALAVPPAPARVVVPFVLAEPEPPPAPPPAPAATAPASTPRPSTPTTPARPADRPETPTAPPPATRDTPVLQTTTDAPSTEQRTRELLTEAQRNLDRVRKPELGAQAREQYDTVVGYIRAAQQALQLKNYLYAQQLATKAATLARELVKG